MDSDDIDATILRLVAHAQGIKLVDLWAKYIFEDAVVNVEAEGETELSTRVAHLVAEGKLIELEYTLPNLDSRVRSFLLPGKSSVILRNT